MTIAEVERRTGLTRANIRFYEKEGLLSPVRGDNGYRDYTEQDVRTLEKIGLLRRLHIAVPVIRALERGERTLAEVVQEQTGPLTRERQESEQALAICRAILEDGASFGGLDPNRYLSPAMEPGGEQALQNDRLRPAGHPWARYFARSFDLGLYGLLVDLVTRWLLRWNPPSNIVSYLLLDYARIALMLLFEPILLRYWGATPGKWIFGLSVRGAGGQKLTWADAMGRTLSVFRGGLGYGVPFYAEYRAYVCYQECRERELDWDEENDCAIVAPREHIHPGRVVGFVLVDALCFMLALGILFRAELPPHRGELTLDEYTANCNDYLRYRGLPGRVTKGEWSAWSPETGMVYISLDAVQQTAVQTDENGMVTAVTLCVSSEGVLNKDNFYLRDMLFYAFAVSHERLGIWQTWLSPAARQLADFTASYETALGSLQIDQQVTYTGYDEVGEQYLWPRKDGQAAFHMVFTITKA